MARPFSGQLFDMSPSRKVFPQMWHHFTQAQLVELFDFNRYTSQTISQNDYLDFLRYFLKQISKQPKIREIIFRQFKQPHDVQNSEGFDWDRFNREVCWG
ncbi:hypothetical protein H2248_009599 [Termitomyces sp. 'cryptogamus']|nr:hypothetical protein H2248_009599 [Termitomyces sp. 'cryptogamus']